MEKKLELLEKARKNLGKVTEETKGALKGKDKEIQDLKDEVRQAKDVTVREYHDSDALISKLGESFLHGFDDAIHQVKKAYPDLDVSKIKVEDPPQTSVMPTALDDTDDLFAGDDVIGNGESTQAKSAQVQPEVETALQFVVNEAQVQQLS